MTLRPAASPGLGERLFPPGSDRAIHLLRAAWPRAVGEELARRTEVLAVEGRTLRIRVPDASWGRVLHRLEREILMRLRRALGSSTPGRLGFTVGPVGAPPEEREPAVREDAEAPELVRVEAAAIQDPELRGRFVEVAARYLARRRRNG
jgi:hypothetical protein